MAADANITLLLERLAGGDADARAELISLVYPHLRRLAARKLRGEGVDHTLQPTALVHEAYLRLVHHASPVHWTSRAHFFAVAATQMRNILVDHARAKKTIKRGEGAIHQDLDMIAAEGVHKDRLLIVHDALIELAKLSPRQCQIVEMRFFAGLTEEEIASVLSVSGRTVKRDWAMAKAWLQGYLND